MKNVNCLDCKNAVIVHPGGVFMDRVKCFISWRDNPHGYSIDNILVTHGSCENYIPIEIKINKLDMMKFLED